MDRYVDYHVQRISLEPLDILVVPTLLPVVLATDYDRLWTPPRTQSVVEAAVKHNVALEIDCRFRVPSFRFSRRLGSRCHLRLRGPTTKRREGLATSVIALRCTARLGLTPRQFFCPRSARSQTIEIR